MATILLVSPGHAPTRTSRQPWAYIQGIAEQLANVGNEVTVVGDGPDGDFDTSSVRFEAVESVRSPESVSDVAVNLDPDVCLWSVGPTSMIFLFRRLPRLADTMGAVVPGPLYSPSELYTQLSGNDLLNVQSYASLVASSFVPQRGFAYFLQTNFDLAIAPSTTIVDQLTSGDFSQEDTLHVPHGSDTGILTIPEEVDEFRESVPSPPAQDYIVNFGPPRQIRGATDFVEAIQILRDQGQEVKGVMLARIDDETDRESLADIRAELSRARTTNDFLITEEYLTPHELKSYIRGASAVVLPYRIVQSTVPISIIEALALGTPVVTTDVSGARELVPSSDLTVGARDADALVETIQQQLGGSVYSQAELTSQLPRWEESIQPLVRTLANEEPLCTMGKFGGVTQE